jgi:hypothetical protein
MSAPVPGPSEPWVTSDDLREMVNVRKAIAKAIEDSTKASNETPISTQMIDDVLSRAVGMATEVLFDLSGRRYAGENRATIRPVYRPVNADTLGMMRHSYSYGGYGGGSRAMSAQTAFTTYGNNDPPVIEFDDYPIRSIVEVKINGVIIPPDEYYLRGNKELVRMRVSATSTPTQQWGWPMAQVQDLPDTEPGTFSITYTYGADPGEGGRGACLQLAEMYACSNLGDKNRYPERMTSITRQGVSAQVASIVDVMKEGGTGLYVVDMWLKSVNPSKQRQRSLVWSPSRPSNRRQ